MWRLSGARKLLELAIKVTKFVMFELIIMRLQVSVNFSINMFTNNFMRLGNGKRLTSIELVHPLDGKQDDDSSQLSRALGP